jgi:hypothetical protein
MDSGGNQGQDWILKGDRMENGKIFLVDDDRDEMWQAKIALEGAGHQIVLKASDLLMAIKMICEGQLQKTGVQVAVLDASLRRSFVDPLDGAILAHIIRCLGLPVKVVSRSRLRLPKENGGYGDQDACKSDGDEGLLNAIAAL